MDGRKGGESGVGWFSDEVLFYGGIAVTACACIGAVIAVLILKIRTMHLKRHLDEEYGPELKRSGGR